MEVCSIVVNVDLDTANATSLKYAIDLAGKFDAELIGVAAEEPSFVFAGIESGAAAANLYATERTEIEKRLGTAEEQFRSMIPAGLKAQWRAFVASPLRCLIDTARLADVIVTAPTTTSAFQVPMHVDLGELVLATGRPVLNVGEGMTEAKMDKLMIGWKDTREARRAVADALPFLARAKEVVALTVSEGDFTSERRQLDDLISWLSRHGVAARGDVINNKDGFTDVLASTALAEGVDLLVAGGYGHSRMREWLFGGMTRSLLEANGLSRLFSN